MMFIGILFIFAMGMALVDFFLFLNISSGIGIYFIIFSQLITFGIGFFFLRGLDFSLYFYLDAELKKGQKIISELWDEAWVLTAACLLMMPGIISDIVGGLCLIKAVREFLISYFNE